jgi:uncharacterized protein YndB with AHSA1/START domain
MKLKTEVIIDADRASVWRVFDNPENLTKWQPALRSFTHKSGTPGQPDAISELVYEENGREVVMLETITARREPEFLAGTYESKWCNSVIFNHFEETEDGNTRWVAYWNNSFKGFMKIMAFFLRNSLCNRTESDMQRFKLLVETKLAEDKS